MKNKDRVERCLEDLTSRLIDREDFLGIETTEIAEKLNLKRNSVSHYLNVLVDEGKVIKRKSRPVYFIHKGVMDKYKEEKDIIEGKKEKSYYTYKDVIEEEILKLKSFLIEYDKRNITIDYLKKEVRLCVNKILSIIVYKDFDFNDEILRNNYNESVKVALDKSSKLYGFKYYKNAVNAVSKILLFFNKYTEIDEFFDDYNKTRIREIKNKIFWKENIISDYIIKELSSLINYKNSFIIDFFFTIYIFTITDNKDLKTNIILMAHGESTARSLSSVVNKYFGEFLITPFDFSLDTKREDKIKTIKGYLNSVCTFGDNIILVDMEELLEISDEIESIVKGHTLIIKNITTDFIIEISKKVNEGSDLNSIIQILEEENNFKYKLVKGKKKERAILTTCVSGIGTSVKIKELLSRCIDDKEINIIPYEYGRLANKGLDDEIFNDYDVKLIISTTDLKIEGIECILLNDLMKIKSYEKINKALIENIDKDKVQIIRKDLAKHFSFENIISKLTILNPQKTINEVETIVTSMEKKLKKNFTPELRMLLYIHMSIMIERLMINKGIDCKEDELKDYIKNNKRIIKIIEDSFYEIGKEYNLVITTKEVQIIQEIIEGRIGKL